MKSKVFAFFFKSLGLCFGLWGLYGSALAQPSNDQVYTRLLEGFLSEQSQAYQEIQGKPVAAFLPEIHIDTASRTTLRISTPTITYERLKPKLFIRSLKIRVSQRDSTTIRKTLSFADTLDRKAVLSVYKQSPYELQGDKPTDRARWLRPAFIVGASVGGIWALFFLRS